MGGVRPTSSSKDAFLELRCTLCEMLSKNAFLYKTNLVLISKNVKSYKNAFLRICGEPPLLSVLYDFAWARKIFTVRNFKLYSTLLAYSFKLCTRIDMIHFRKILLNQIITSANTQNWHLLHTSSIFSLHVQSWLFEL